MCRVIQKSVKILKFNNVWNAIRREIKIDTDIWSDMEFYLSLKKLQKMSTGGALTNNISNS